jgi:4-carboxymuconolactone decarboxylase
MSNELFDQGLEIRREVLGSEFVDASLKSADDFNMPMQELSTEYCWGKIWSREGLSRKERSMLNLGMIAALNRPHELKLHVRGALTNGVTKDQMREIFMQVAVYCGIPAGMDAFRCAREVFADMERQAGK